MRNISIILFYLLILRDNNILAAKVNYFLIQQVCAEKFNISPKELETYHKNITGYSENYNIKCYTNCLFENNQVMLNAELLYKETRARFNRFDFTIRNTMYNIWDACQNSTHGESDACDAAYNLMVCLDSAINLFNRL